MATVNGLSLSIFASIFASVLPGFRGAFHVLKGGRMNQRPQSDFTANTDLLFSAAGMLWPAPSFP